MKSYLLRLICGAFVCALTDAISAGPGQKARRMAAGIFLILTALSVPKQWELPELNFGQIRREAEAAAASGQIQSENARADIITDSYCAYILNEAAALGLSPEVCVTLNEDLTPESVVLRGAASPGVRQRLSKIIAEGLGLGEEDVIWNDFHQSSA